MMKISRLGLFALLLTTVVVSVNCSYYNRIWARKSLVDGAKSFKDRNFKDAEEKFRVAVEYDPELNTLESKTAQLFLARTVHSEYAGNRDDTPKAELAVKEYKRALDGFLSELKQSREANKASPENEDAKKSLKNAEKEVGSIIRAVASLYANLKQDGNWKEWQTTQAANEILPNETRASAYVSLGAKEYTCANDITDTKEVKKTVKEGDKEVFKFSKPENEEDFDKLKKCVETGTDFIEKAVELNPESDSAWSYKASLTEQNRRIADMQGKNEKVDSLKEEFNSAKKKFEELAEKRREAEKAEEKRIAEEKAKKEGKEPKAKEESEDDE